jgi:hypothetical protein
MKYSICSENIKRIRINKNPNPKLYNNFTLHGLGEGIQVFKYSMRVSYNIDTFREFARLIRYLDAI